MSSTAEPFAQQSTELDVAALWAKGEALVNHPRVRIVAIGDTRVTVHRHAGLPPVGIKTLAGDPLLRVSAGLRHIGPDGYVMNFIEGTALDSLPATSEHAEPILQAMLAVWHRPTVNVEAASREHPVMGAVTRTQFIEMPDAVLASAREHQASIERVLMRLSARGEGSAVIHGDLKADNIIVGAENHVRFIDWECCGVGHPEDDVASLLASACVYGLARAVRNSLAPTDALGAHESLEAHVTRELEAAREFGQALLDRIHHDAPDISTSNIGSAFLISTLCRLQGLLFVPSSEAVRLVVSEFVRRSMERGPDAIRDWLLGNE